MIRLFASDMDGTLLNDKGYISDRTINAVKKLQKHGIHFIEILEEIIALQKENLMQHLFPAI